MQAVTMQVDESEIVAQAMDILKTKYGLDAKRWVDSDGNLTEEQWHPHRPYDTIVGKATSDQIKVQKTVHAFLELYRAQR